MSSLPHLPAEQICMLSMRERKQTARDSDRQSEKDYVSVKMTQCVCVHSQMCEGRERWVEFKGAQIWSYFYLFGASVWQNWRLCGHKHKFPFMSPSREAWRVMAGFFLHCFTLLARLFFFPSSLVTALFLSGLQWIQKQRTPGMNTCWMLCQFIAGHHPHTHSHLGVV